MQKVLIFGKKSVHHLDSNLRPPECKSVALTIEPYGCGFRWNAVRVFSISSSLRSAAERNLITTLTCGDKLEVGGQWVYDVRQLIS